MVSTGLLAPGASRLSVSDGKGVNETWKGRIHLRDRSTVPVYVKFLKAKQLINEFFGAELARAVGFQVPDSYLVKVYKNQHPAMFDELGIKAEFTLAFGSRDVAVKSLVRRYRDEGKTFAMWFINHCPCWRRVVSFDGWVANSDRNFGNALLGGPDDLWLIDHDRCFTGPSWSSTRLVPDAAVPNKLLSTLNRLLTDDIKDAVANEASDAQKLFSLADVEGALEDSKIAKLLSSSEQAALISFIEQRKTKIIDFVNAALGRPTLPLPGVTHV